MAAVTDEREAYAHPDDVAGADQTAARVTPGLRVRTSNLVPPGLLIIADASEIAGGIRDPFTEDETASPS